MRWTAILAIGALVAVSGCKGELKDPNKLKLQTYTKAQGTSWEKYEGIVQMKTAVVTRMSGQRYLTFQEGEAGCDVLEKRAEGVRVNVALDGLSKGQADGSEPLKGVMPSRGAVILIKGFNSMLLLHDAKKSEVAWRGGQIKPGAEVSGTIDIHENPDRPLAEGRYSIIQGSFRAKVCP